MTTNNTNINSSNPNSTTSNQRSTGNCPGYEAVIPVNGNNGDTTWQKIGVVWRG